MKFSERVDQASEFLRQRERVSYRALKREFDLDDETLEDVKAELIDARRVARDEDGKVLVWVGVSPVPNTVVSPQPPTPSTQHLSAERRQLTVMFCDLVGSTALSARLDPEELRDIVRTYQQTCAEVIHRHEGYIAQYLGDGLLVYFGYPTAHEDDARRAVRTGLGIIEAIKGQESEDGGQIRQQPLQVRIGIHTGLGVIGDIGAGGRTEQLALGETPNLAARIQGLAEPNTVLISAATQRLIAGQFDCQPFGTHLVKGIETPIAVHQIARVLEERFPQTKEAQPELLAHHYTEAGLIGQAISCWQQAGERANQRSAYVEAINHLTTELELLKLLSDTLERTQQELSLQVTLGIPLIAAKGQAAPEVERAYTRARELCRQVGETPQILRVLTGLWVFYLNRAEHKTAHELAEQCLRLGQGAQDPYGLVWAHCFMGMTLFNLGEFALAQDHMEQGIALYDPQQHRALALRSGGDPGMLSLSEMAFALWCLGYPDQALRRLCEALTLVQDVSIPYNLAVTLANSAMLHHFRREEQATQERAEALRALSSEQGFPLPLASGTIWRGWALVEQGQGGKEIEQMRQGLAAYRATEEELWRPYYLALLAEACEKVGQTDEGFAALTEALTVVDKTGERFYEAELYRLKGTLTLQEANQKSKGKGQKAKIGADPQPLTPDPQAEAEAEACFLKAIKVARKQQAKSWELRASTSLARLWQQQGKKAEAHKLLTDAYNWFTEGFDTKDLQEAKALFEELRA